MAKNFKRGGKDSGRRADRKPEGRKRAGSDSWDQRKSRDNNNPRKGGEGLRVEKRDKSKVIVKEAAPKGQKKISLKQLRREGGKGGKKALVLSKKGGQKEGKKGDMRSKKDLGRRNKKGGRHGRKGGNRERDGKVSLETLDKEMESYWVKGGHSELATQRLDDDLAGYFEKQEAAAEAANKAEAGAEEKKD